VKVDFMSFIKVVEPKDGTDNLNFYYRPELDALRFFAFLATFIFHRMDYVPTSPQDSPWLWNFSTAGAFGVPVFFLLSAFLITELLTREQRKTGTINIRSFYVRRILRIWPLYFAAFIGLCLLNIVVPGVGSNDPLAWLAFSLFAGNWYVTIKGWIAGPIDPLWSISVEEQFYLIIPLIITVWGRRGLVWTCAIFILSSYTTILAYAWTKGATDEGQWTNSFVHFQFFAAGTLLSLWLKGRVPDLGGWQRLLLLIFSAGCWVIAVAVFDVRSWNPQPSFVGAVPGWLLVLAGTSAFFFAFFGLSAKLIPEWLRYLGRISFGLYVFHSLIFWILFFKVVPALGFRTDSLITDIAGTTIALLATIVCSHWSYQYLERPFLRLKGRFSFISTGSTKL
jgi:peptidoglycan/LPS O-acetylase OafA/YrhL